MHSCRSMLALECLDVESDPDSLFKNAGDAAKKIYDEYKKARRHAERKEFKDRMTQPDPLIANGRKPESK